jgi:hypothetical protein
VASGLPEPGSFRSQIESYPAQGRGRHILSG